MLVFASSGCITLTVSERISGGNKATTKETQKTKCVVLFQSLKNDFKSINVAVLASNGK